MLSGNVDLDIAYKDYQTIIREKRLNNYNDREEKKQTDSEINYVIKKII